MGSLNLFKEVLNRLRMYGNGYSMAIVLDHRSSHFIDRKLIHVHQSCPILACNIHFFTAVSGGIFDTLI